MLFSLDKYLILGGRTSTDLQVWDFQQNKIIKTIDVQSGNHAQVTFSPDGECYVLVVRKLTLLRQRGGS